MNPTAFICFLSTGNISWKIAIRTLYATRMQGRSADGKRFQLTMLRQRIRRRSTPWSHGIGRALSVHLSEPRLILRKSLPLGIVGSMGFVKFFFDYGDVNESSEPVRVKCELNSCLRSNFCVPLNRLGLLFHCDGAFLKHTHIFGCVSFVRQSHYKSN